MKQIKLVFTGLLLSGLLMGCTEEEKKVEQVKAEEAENEVVTIETKTEVNSSKVWKDVSKPDGFNDYGIEPTLKAWIAYHAEDITKTTDVNEYYSRANRLTKELSYFRVQGEDLEKDFENLNVLQTFMGHLDYVISVEEEQGIDTAEAYEELKVSFKYFTELLQDLNSIINDNSQGEIFGLTHQLDGNRVDELEKFLYSEAVEIGK
ncbi:hypothetical protein [Lysinibacillus sp. FSL M8-0134]|uniref:hypothetical protein n=1 Tax=Lysinibacillus sp. FSL M8-0134 TaxID=2921717 RepID=UPI00311A476E